MADRVITVSELRCACLDAEWRRRWLADERPSTRSFAPAGAVASQGAAFHRLAEQFTDWMLQAGQAATVLDAEALWGALHDYYAGGKLQTLAAEGKLPSAHHLSQALRAFCVMLVALRERTPDFRSWQDIFLTHEYALDRVPLAISGGGRILISGRPDAVRTVPGAGLEVVDYKLSRGADLKRDLLQLAIYARLLCERKPGLEFSGVLEYYEPGLHLVSASAAELQDLFEEAVAPVLPELAGREETSPPPPRKTFAGRQLAEAIQACYADFKLTVTILGREEAPQLVRYRVKPAGGVKVASLANRAEDLQVALGLPQTPLIRAAAGCVTIDLPKEHPDPVSWVDVMQRADFPAAPLAFPIGIGIDGALITADFADANTCHALVAGMSGSGKSEFLKALVATLLTRNDPARLRVTLIDPKAVTFAKLAGARHLACPIITDPARATEVLEAAVADLETRYALLARAGLENIEQAGATAYMPYHVLIFDEFSDLVLRGKAERERFESLVTRLAQKGRAAGIHLILATQRPDARVVTGLVKSNLPLRICLRVTSGVNSQIVLGEVGAETLLGKGDLLCDRGRGLERAQAPMVAPTVFDRLG